MGSHRFFCAGWGRFFWGGGCRARGFLRGFPMIGFDGVIFLVCRPTECISMGYIVARKFALSFGRWSCFHVSAAIFIRKL